MAPKNNGATTKKPKRRTTTVVRRDGRGPLGLGAAIGMMMTERGLAAPAAGGSVLDRWPDIAAALAPQLPDHVQAVAFHPETGQLDLRPASPAYATQLRLISARIVAAVNEAVGTDAVRAVGVLPVGAERDAPGPMLSFAQSLCLDAVTAGLTLPWSSGIVEGNVNRIKTIKRAMYGRASFRLLRTRILLRA
ncbi:DciA family protein [Streptomyces sp. AN091965]|uniref:DciA family protein n=1 Tax=Streptomyces sp. AN091965 TaxID=2927803 RepID=UPI0035A949FD